MRKQIDPRQSGRQTSLSYSGLVKAVCIAWYVVRLKNSVPADWMAAHHAARPPPGECRSDQASQLCSPPPAVNRIEPMKRDGVSRLADKLHVAGERANESVDPRAKKRAIQRSRLKTRRSFLSDPPTGPTGFLVRDHRCPIRQHRRPRPMLLAMGRPWPSTRAPPIRASQRLTV